MEQESNLLPQLRLLVRDGCSTTELLEICGSLAIKLGSDFFFFEYASVTNTAFLFIQYHFYLIAKIFYQMGTL